VSFLDRLLRGKPPATGEDADRITLRKLQGMGADLTKPREIIHFLDLPTEASARAVAEELEQAGYAASVTEADDAEATWAVRAEAMRIVDMTTVPGFRAWFESLATRHGGEYDGWEVSPRP
jgi:hypothetical protein